MKNQIVACMFCGNLPCTCGGPTKTGSKRPTKTSSPSPQPKATPSTDSSAIWEASVSTPRFGAKLASQQAYIDSEYTQETVAALRNLFPILSKETQDEYRDVVEPKLTPDQFRRRGEIVKRLTDG